jgi:hypothetical protein
LQETGTCLKAYLDSYKQQWSELMESDDPLLDYPDRSVWTTWEISYQAIRKKHEQTANLLLLWSFLDNKDLWHGLFTGACEREYSVAETLSEWIGKIASSEIQFGLAMKLLRNYSLVEEVVESDSHATHPVVHQWARHSQGCNHRWAQCARPVRRRLSFATPTSATCAGVFETHTGNKGIRSP